jgi:predicted small secreted protein
MKMKTKCYLIGATIGIAAVLFAGESLNPLFAMFGKEVQVS